MTLKWIQNPDEFREVINRDEPTLIYFTDTRKGPPGPEFAALSTDKHPAAQKETFFVDLGAEYIPGVPSQAFVTILYRNGQELDTAAGGDMSKFFELSERVAAGN
ncbi:hypothetical protein PENANT_c004G02871 [Penicillium antarcticum]|uniref:Thioredoxin domain-containing protein n=1 Tax=Penicillium antarcticum TaxID=416450 RepID=A0A1V6QGM4_9EURO|nr:uncharacterized protein N7508_002554 [Penicillium antarcticum]KAJ5318046.1 hypothetical protein N7508_002554 [Penicillium antarcticum]OQD88371.1 hypothetical protein PENANT_c004G02871 [Penicillium antarcticum]